ncbi:hypothetical protein HCJ07_14480 [Listeria booriae]|uniref:hypothetical protein n=1 Tax=Listeria booriae TaxID=1552123 RepID=UPI001625ADDE|nr:hypothetical protein [Listeria booriae]MBC1505081.1 hypothetical protein [Listeria booriae]MBC1531552.1 hypothetical protein [Listeria booriae]
MLFPNSPELLEYRYQLLQNYFAFAFHEIPSGILHGMNGATVDEAREGLRALEEYTGISKQLGYLNENIIPSVDQLLKNERFFHPI